MKIIMAGTELDFGASPTKGAKVIINDIDMKDLIIEVEADNAEVVIVDGIITIRKKQSENIKL